MSAAPHSTPPDLEAVSDDDLDGPTSEVRPHLPLFAVPACSGNRVRTEDAAFDALYPPAIHAISRRHWTPVNVARQAGQLFRQAGARRVLDVGSGVGKFVLVAAAEVPEMAFVGVERREHLVEVARSAHARLSVPNASFLVGDATEMPWLGFDGFYFFNPFAENLFVDGDRIDNAVDLNRPRFVRDTHRVQRTLNAAPLGTAIVTYHGMSGPMPACYELSRRERAGSDWLRLWVKTRERADGFFIEWGDGLVLHRADGTSAWVERSHCGAED